MHEVLRITTPSRLHFGLLRFAQAQGRSFGGLGMMIKEPRLVVEIQESDQWQAAGPMADQALATARKIQEQWRRPQGNGLRIQICESPLPHSGFGSGTQLALALALGMHTLSGSGPVSLEAIVSATNRGKRSAVGSYGFERGGLIWETGYRAGEPLGHLSRRLAVPDSWRLVLILPHSPPGLHGDSEAETFDQLTPVPAEVSAELQQIAETQILPAAERADFDAFARSIFQYGHLAGNCFRQIQGGPYASPAIARCIDRLRRLGVAGVGQSSWGPTLFAFCQAEREAAELAGRLAGLKEFSQAKILLTAPDNCGAQVETIADSSR
ncbi:MAG: hypothetical protein MK171_10990 [Pirellulales bacterium]|nr:hypothetical protein [Pirellulales bacterium]